MSTYTCFSHIHTWVLYCFRTEYRISDLIHLFIHLWIISGIATFHGDKKIKKVSSLSPYAGRVFGLMSNTFIHSLFILILTYSRVLIIGPFDIGVVKPSQSICMLHIANARVPKMIKAIVKICSGENLNSCRENLNCLPIYRTTAGETI